MSPEEFKTWRAYMGLSQAAAAKALGVSQGTIELYERGMQYGGRTPVVIPLATELACAALQAGITRYERPQDPASVFAARVKEHFGHVHDRKTGKRYWETFAREARFGKLFLDRKLESRLKEVLKGAIDVKCAIEVYAMAEAFGCSKPAEQAYLEFIRDLKNGNPKLTRDLERYVRRTCKQLKDDLENFPDMIFTSFDVPC